MSNYAKQGVPDACFKIPSENPDTSIFLWLKNVVFQRYMFAMEICDNFILYFKEVFNLGAWKLALFYGVITFLNERNQNNKTQVTAV